MCFAVRNKRTLLAGLEVRERADENAVAERGRDAGRRWVNRAGQRADLGAEGSAGRQTDLLGRHECLAKEGMVCRAAEGLPSEHPVGGVAGRRGDLVRLQVAAAEGGDELEAEDVDVDGR